MASRIPNFKIPMDSTVDLSGQVELGEIPDVIMYDRLRDGRIMGLLVEDILQYHFRRLTRVVSNTSRHDLIFDTGRGDVVRVQCKTSKTNKFNISPSSMIGSGRRFDEDLFLDYLGDLDAFVFVNISEFPILSVHSRSIDWIQENMVVTRSSGYVVI